MRRLFITAIYKRINSTHKGFHRADRHSLKPKELIQETGKWAILYELVHQFLHYWNESRIFWQELLILHTHDFFFGAI